MIVAVVATGLVAAAASWWFRYSATHRAAQFWGPAAARLIRDAPNVRLIQFDPSPGGQVELGGVSVFDLPDGVPGARSWQIAVDRDISATPGLTHLRHALLEDQNFTWPASDEPPAVEWTTQLQFHAGAEADAESVTILFSLDYHWLVAAAGEGAMGPAVSCRPIATGLREMFEPLAAGAESPR